MAFQNDISVNGQHEWRTAVATIYKSLWKLENPFKKPLQIATKEEGRYKLHLKFNSLLIECYVLLNPFQLKSYSKGKLNEI